MTRQHWQQLVATHPELSKGIDLPSQSDRRWFHKHRGEVVRLRPLMSEEADAVTAVARAAGTGIEQMAIQDEIGQEIPNTWMAVVDLHRLVGLPHGDNGESNRLRLMCPEPPDDMRIEFLKALAIDRAMGGLLALALRGSPQ